MQVLTTGTVDLTRDTVVLTDPTFDPKDNDDIDEDMTATTNRDAGVDPQTRRDYNIWQALYDGGDTLTVRNQDLSLRLEFNGDTTTLTSAAIVIDLFGFGLENDLEDNFNNAIYRLELEEDGDNSSDFIGTLEYVGLNQINILERSTYEGTVDAFGDSIVLISDDDDVSIDYLDLDSTGGTTKFTAEADTPTHSGVVSLGSDGYKVGDTVEITVADADLNVDSGKADVYTVVTGEFEVSPAVADDPEYYS